MTKFFYITFYCFFIIISIGCNKAAYKSKAILASYESTVLNDTPNYTQLAYWAAHPYKYDVSDSVPKDIVGKYMVDSTVDVFFVHPTTYIEKEKSLGYNAPINNAVLNAKTDFTAILYQASAFNNGTRVFAPRYRQANINCYYPTSFDDSLQCIKAFELAYYDVKMAFLTFIKQFNGNRPFIIASHSQGTTHAKRLIKEFIEGTVLQNRMVAAYLIGIVVPENYFVNLPACGNPNQTGCYVSWRTVKDDFIPAYAINEKFTATVTNPLTWNVQIPIADKNQNKGSMLYDFNKIMPNITAAKVKGNFLSTHKPKFFGNIFFNRKDYHIGDINLYYINIKENVAQRISAFWKH
jgi:hypothetical protein